MLWPRGWDRAWVSSTMTVPQGSTPVRVTGSPVTMRKDRMMFRSALTISLAAIALLAACDQPALTSSEIAGEGVESAVERLPEGEGTMTDGSAPAPGTAGL